MDSSRRELSSGNPDKGKSCVCSECERSRSEWRCDHSAKHETCSGESSIPALKAKIETV